MKKKIVLTILAVALLTGCGKTATLENGQEKFVEFEDESMTISVDDVWDELKDNYGLTTTLNMIDKKILEDKYKDDLDDANEYADSQQASLESNYASEEILLQMLQMYGYGSVEAYRDDQYISYLKDKETLAYAKTQVTEKEIKAYYKNESVGDIDCNHILVKPESDSDSDVEAAKEKAEEIIAAIKKDVKSGTSVADAFAKYKDDDSVTYQELGYFNKGDMVEEFEEAAYALKKGAYTTTPVKTTYGYHIIYKVDEKDKDTYDNLKDSITETLAQEKVDNDSNSVLETKAMMALRKEYGVKWDDSEMEERYNTYMNYLLNQDEE